MRLQTRLISSHKLTVIILGCFLALICLTAPASPLPETDGTKAVQTLVVVDDNGEVVAGAEVTVVRCRNCDATKDECVTPPAGNRCRSCCALRKEFELASAKTDASGAAKIGRSVWSKPGQYAIWITKGAYSKTIDVEVKPDLIIEANQGTGMQKITTTIAVKVPFLVEGG